jgi:cytochrome c-type biogenesis protein CcmH/NrfF
MFVFKHDEEIWVYWAVTIPLTLLVMAIWVVWMSLRSRKLKDAQDEETNSQDASG